MPGKSSPKSFVASARIPYTVITPRRRKLWSTDVETEELKTFSEQLSEGDILSRTWKTHRLTALYNFRYDKRSLQRYSKLIAAYIELEHQKDCALYINGSSKYKVDIKVLDEFSQTSIDSPSLNIVVTSADDEAGVPLFSCFLLSVERHKLDWEELNVENFIILPLFISHGKAVYLNSMKNFIEEQFGSGMFPLTFSSLELMWMLALWAPLDIDEDSKPVLVEYAVPMQELSKIQYSISAPMVIAAWKKAHKGNENEVNVDEVRKFVDILEKIFLRELRINLAHFKVTSIGTRVAMAKNTGYVKIRSEEEIPLILRHLTRLCQESSLSSS